MSEGVRRDASALSSWESASPAIGGALEGTRRRILNLIAENGPITAADIARELDITPAGVRRHLVALEEDLLITDAETIPAAPRGRGRPARRYVMSAAGHDDLPSAYDDIAREALAYLTEQLGPGAIDGFARSRAQGLTGLLQERVDAAGPEPADRALALADALTDAGFAATARTVGANGNDANGIAGELGAAGEAVGVQLCQGHCPVQQVAAEYPSLCDAESEAFAALLGVHVQRLSTLAGGGHVCTTFVPVRSPGGPAQHGPALPDSPRRAARTHTMHSGDNRRPAEPHLDVPHKERTPR